MIKNLPKNSSPGEDGIPYDFYIHFWDYIEDTFVEIFRAVLLSKSVTPSQSVGLIRLVAKVDHPTKISKYRPIALLNCVYKIMASALAGRLKRTLPSVISTAQCGGVPDRRITDNLTIYRDVIAFIEDRNVGE